MLSTRASSIQRTASTTARVEDHAGVKPSTRRSLSTLTQGEWLTCSREKAADAAPAAAQPGVSRRASGRRVVAPLVQVEAYMYMCTDKHAPSVHFSKSSM